MKLTEELYQYIAGQTKSIGESASDILRRLLNLPCSNVASAVQNSENVSTEAILPNTCIESEQEVQTNELINIPVKKQSDEAIQKSDKVRNLLYSEEFQQETKAVVRF